MLTSFEKCCIVRRYLPSTNPAQTKTIVLKYSNENTKKDFIPSIHNLHLFHLCHNLKIDKKQDITFTRVS